MGRTEKLWLEELKATIVANDAALFTLKDYLSLHSINGSGIRHFQMKEQRSDLAEQYQLAGAGGIEPPNGGIKIR